MAEIRISEKPQLADLVGTEALLAQAIDGGTDTDSNPVAAGNDVHITVEQLAAFCAAYRSVVTTINHSAVGALDLDYSLGDYFIVNLGANVSSITISNPPASGLGGSIRVKFLQDTTGSRTVTLPSSFKAITGTDSAVQAAANSKTVMHLSTDNAGTTWDYSMKAGAV